MSQFDMVNAQINERYEIVLPRFRRDFHADRPKWESGRLESCFELMYPGMTVFDIGAEHGDFTSLYKIWVGDDGDVIPIEPMGHYWPFIKQTWEANGFDNDPELKFVGLVSDHDQGSRPFDGYLDWPVEAQGEGVPDGGFMHLKHSPNADQTTIDDIAVYVIPDAIVIDIEGAEWHALSGATNTLQERRPLVWVSIHDIADGNWHGPLKDWYGKTPDDIHSLMDSFGYSREELPYFGEGEHFWLYLPQ